MSKLKDFVMFLIFLSVPFKSLCTKYPCNITNEYGSDIMCQITGLHLTQENYTIEPTGDNLTDVEAFGLFDSVVPIISKEICDALPNLKRFHARFKFVEDIEEDAFQGCKHVVHIDLQDNKFRKLNRNTFKGLPNLEQLWVQSGNIPVLDLDLSGTNKVKSLDLSGLNITLFPAETLRGLNNLRELSLYSNNLFDLGIEKILEFTPNLETIWINDNNFKCSRLREIISLLKSEGVKIDTWKDRDFLRKREYTPDQIDEIMCLSDQLWEAEISKSYHQE